MRRYYDLAEDPEFWDLLDDLPGDPEIVGELVATLVQFALDDPYRSTAQDGIGRVLTSKPVMRDGVLYAFSIGYIVIDYPAPRDGMHGVVIVLHVRACNAEQMLAASPVTARDRDH